MEYRQNPTRVVFPQYCSTNFRGILRDRYLPQRTVFTPVIFRVVLVGHRALSRVRGGWYLSNLGLTQDCILWRKSNRHRDAFSEGKSNRTRTAQNNTTTHHKKRQNTSGREQHKATQQPTTNNDSSSSGAVHLSRMSTWCI